MNRPAWSTGPRFTAPSEEEGIMSGSSWPTGEQMRRLEHLSRSHGAERESMVNAP